MLKIILLSFLFINTSWARQYIQCSDTQGTSIVSVVNLATHKEGTFFMSSGMENDETERLLCSIQWRENLNGKVYYDLSGLCQGEISFEEEMLNRSSNDLFIDVNFSGWNLKFVCFSRIYQD